MDAEIVAIRLAIGKVTTTGCKNIIILTIYQQPREVIDTSIHSRQQHSIAMARALRSHFTANLDGSLHFWNCSTGAKWFIHGKGWGNQFSDRGANTRVIWRHLPEQQQRQNVGVDEGITEGSNRGRNFLITYIHKRMPALPTYTKGGTWMSHSVTLCARALRIILGHAPVGEYRARFFLNEPTACPCGETDLATKMHILMECPRYTKDRITSQVTFLKGLVQFLTSNPTAFAFPTREPPERAVYKEKPITTKHRLGFYDSKVPPRREGTSLLNQLWYLLHIVTSFLFSFCVYEFYEVVARLLWTVFVHRIINWWPKKDWKKIAASQIAFLTTNSENAWISPQDAKIDARLRSRRRRLALGTGK